MVARLLGVEGVDDLVQRLFQLLLHLVGVKVFRQVLLDAHQRRARVGAQELRRQLVILLRPLRRAQLAHALVHQHAQRAVGVVVGERHRDLVVHLGARHQRGALGHVHHAGEQLLHLADLRRAHLVLDHRVALHHVGRCAARIGVGVVDARLVDHVLAQVVAADVHQLAGVQRAAAQVRRAARVRGHAVEHEVRAHDGHIAIRAHLVDGARVPGVGKVHVVKAACARDELLGARALLGRAAKEDHRAVHLVLDHVVLQRHGRRKRARADQVVAAAVTRAAGHHRLLGGAGRLLRQPVQRVVLSQQAHHRLARTDLVGGGKRRGDVRDVVLDGKALGLERLHQRPCGLRLLIRELRIAPNLAGQTLGHVRLVRDEFLDLFDLRHVHPPFSRLSAPIAPHLLQYHTRGRIYNTMLRNLMVAGSCGQVKI